MEEEKEELEEVQVGDQITTKKKHITSTTTRTTNTTPVVQRKRICTLEEVEGAGTIIKA